MVGVDTHRDEHVLAVVTAPAGVVIAIKAVGANGRGYREALHVGPALDAEVVRDLLVMGQRLQLHEIELDRVLDQAWTGKRSSAKWPSKSARRRLAVLPRFGIEVLEGVLERSDDRSSDAMLLTRPAKAVMAAGSTLSAITVPFQCGARGEHPLVGPT